MNNCVKSERVLRLFSADGVISGTTVCGTAVIDSLVSNWEIFATWFCSHWCQFSKSEYAPLYPLQDF